MEIPRLAMDGTMRELRKPRQGAFFARSALKRFPAKWNPVRVKKARQNKKPEPRSDSIGSEKALMQKGLARIRQFLPT
jgi:hypothetical protein